MASEDDFQKTVTAWIKTSKERASRIYKEACFRMFSAVVIGSPVDTGLFRNNWYISMGQPSSAKDNPAIGKEPNPVIDRIKTEMDGMDWNLDQTVWFVNNLPYAERLEYQGWSQLAPQGMVRINAMNWPAFVKDAERSVQ